MKLKNLATQAGVILGAGLFAMAASGAQMDFQALKSKCLELSGNQQLKPFKAIVTCSEVSYEWRESKLRGQLPLENAREVGASVVMKGFTTPLSLVEVPVGPSVAPCTSMEKWKLTVPSVDSELSCDELNAIENLTDYCVDQISQRLQEDPSLVIAEATGQVISTCGGALK